MEQVIVKAVQLPLEIDRPACYSDFVSIGPFGLAARRRTS
jgi:hypothetical protein